MNKLRVAHEPVRNQMLALSTPPHQPTMISILSFVKVMKYNDRILTTPLVPARCSQTPCKGIIFIAEMQITGYPKVFTRC